MTNTKTITDFRISWIADHEQYFQGHGVADQSHYTDCATGVGETLREAFEDALEHLAEQGIDLGDPAKQTDTSEAEMLAELTSQVKEPDMLDWDVVKGYCDEAGEHTIEQTCSQCHDDDDDESGECGKCRGSGVEQVTEEDPDCAVCAGEWHYYVSIDVKVEGGQ